MISCYLLFSGTCSHADAALTYFAIHRTSNGKGVTIPSQVRYVRYFQQYLEGYYDLNRPFTFTGVPLLLTHIRLTGIPRFDLVSGGCDPYIMIYQGDRCVYDFHQAKLAPGGHGARSGTNGGLIATSTGETMITNMISSNDGRKEIIDHVDFKMFVWLKADCKFLIYDRDRIGRSNKIAWFWLHTSFISSLSSDRSGSYVCLTKSEIDHAIKDKECKHFPDHFKVELWFKPPFECDEADPMCEPESLTQLATKVLRQTQLKQFEEDYAFNGNGNGSGSGYLNTPISPPSPLTMPFDSALSAEVDHHCHHESIRTYMEYQAVLDEASTLFQPELPPS